MNHIINKTIIAACLVYQSNLIAEENITTQDRSMTSMSKLKNGIPLIVRETKGTDIVHLEVNFKTGTSQSPADKRVIDILTLETMNLATKKFPKSKIYALTEKYSSGVGCAAGVESSKCGFTTVQEYLPQMLDILASTVTEPMYNNEDFELVRKQKIASFQHDIQNPESYVNSLVNSVFYDKDHPYRLLPEDGIKQTKVAKPQDLKERHKILLDSSLMSVVYVGLKPDKKFLDLLDSSLGKIPNKNFKILPVAPPKYDAKNIFAFEHRPIPTAYIRIKFNAPSANSPDTATSALLFEMLSNKLHEEIRTKRSLSYSIDAADIAYSQGIGVIVASTSKPKETLETIATVIKGFKDKAPSQSDVEEHRNIFTTSYYATMESQSQLASALYGAWHYYADPNALYDMQQKLEKVTPQDILKLSQSMLKDFRIGIVFDKEKFQHDWLSPIQKL